TGLLGPATVAPLVVAAAMTVLLSGLSLVGTVQDAISGYSVTAAGRMVEVAISSAGLLVGVVLGLQADPTVGVGLQVAADVQGGGTLVVRVVAGFFALAGYAPARFIAIAALVGAMGFVVYTLGELAGIGPVTATGFAAVAVGAGAGLFHWVSGGPQLAVSLAGIAPLLPGFTAYRGIYQLAVQGAAEGVVTVMLALVIGLALAAGVVLGEWLVSRLTP
ncbi:MAG: threonine/serine exporter family protein, partial [Actinomycetes bacterium]